MSIPSCSKEATLPLKGCNIVITEALRESLPDCVVVPEDGVITLDGTVLLPIIGEAYTAKLPSKDGGTHNVTIRRALAEVCEVK